MNKKLAFWDAYCIWVVGETVKRTWFNTEAAKSNSQWTTLYVSLMLLEKILHLYQKWDKVHQPDPTRYQVSGRPARSMLMVIQPMHLVGQSTSTTGPPWILESFHLAKVVCPLPGEKPRVGFKSTWPHWKVGFQGDGTAYFLLLLQQNLTWEEKKELKGLASPKKRRKKRYAFQSQKKKHLLFPGGFTLGSGDSIIQVTY